MDPSLLDKWKSKVIIPTHKEFPLEQWLFVGPRKFQITQQIERCTSFPLAHKIFYFAVGEKEGGKKSQEKGHLFITVVLFPPDFLETRRSSLDKSHQAIFIQLPSSLNEAWPSLGQATHSRDGRDVTGLHLCTLRITCTHRVWKVISTNRWLLRQAPLQLLWHRSTHLIVFFKAGVQKSFWKWKSWFAFIFSSFLQFFLM